MNIERIKQEVEAFQKLQEELGDFGACDSEPDYHFQRILWDTINSKTVKIPTTASGWELFTSVAGSKAAANRLTQKIKRIVQMIEMVPLGKIPELKTYLEDICWRVS